MPTPAELESEMHGAGAAEASRAGMVFSVAKGPLNFRDPVAVRVGLSMASLAAMLSWVPFINLGFLIWWLAAGFFAVYLYTRRTGQTLSFRNGLRMGWITGVLTFAITTVLFTISMISLAMSSGGLAGVYRQQLQSMQVHDPNLDQALRLFETPAGIATALLFTLVVFFTMITVLCTAGAALAAKVVGRD